MLVNCVFFPSLFSYLFILKLCFATQDSVDHTRSSPANKKSNHEYWLSSYIFLQTNTYINKQQRTNNFKYIRRLAWTRSNFCCCVQWFKIHTSSQQYRITRKRDFIQTIFFFLNTVKLTTNKYVS